MPGVRHLNNSTSKMLHFLEKIMVESEHFQKQVLISLQEHFGYQRASFFLIDPGGNMVAPVTLNIDDYFCDIYCRYFYQKDVFAPQRVVEKLSISEKSSIVTVNDLMPRQHFEMTEYYNDFLSKQDIYHEIAVFLSSNGKLTGVIGLFRSRKEPGFSLQELKLLQQLSFYISRTLTHNLLLENTRQQRDVLGQYTNESPVGLLIFDQYFNICFSNERARIFCHEFCGGSSYEAQQKCLQELLEGTEWQSGLKKRVSTGTSSLTLRIIPSFHHDYHFNTLYMACLCPEEARNPHGTTEKDITGKHSALSQAKLTSRELDILELMIKGYSNQEIARSLFLSIHTVKTHMQNIFKKMDVKNRTSLSYKITAPDLFPLKNNPEHERKKR